MNKEETLLYEELYLSTRELLDDGKDPDFIRDHLSARGADAILIAVVMRQARKDHFDKLRKEGFRLIAIGCVIAFSGFLFTLLNFNTTRSIEFILYGLTTIGISIVFWGVVKIIG